MSAVLITGSAGLIGSEASRFYADQGAVVLGVDNNMRKDFFGEEASTSWSQRQLEADLGSRYHHYDLDIRDADALAGIFKQYGRDIDLVIHTAAQPSHDWAAKDPQTDFSVNANGTLNLLECTRKHAPDAVFIFTSTNKVYGDAPNKLPLVEMDTRWEIQSGHPYQAGIPETMSIDHTLHSLFGVSKTAADLLVQEYGRYFGLKTCCFRGGCLTGPNHSGTQLHGFLAYLMKCAITQMPYTVFGYQGKQVRDNIHSADLIRAFDAFYKNPKPGNVYNMGGGRKSNCSMKEAIGLAEKITGREMQVQYSPGNRIGDHIWYISDLSKFENDYPAWHLQHTVPEIMNQMYTSMCARLGVV